MKNYPISKLSPRKPVRSPRKAVRSPSKFNCPLKKGQKLVTDFFNVTANSSTQKSCVKKNGIPSMLDKINRRQQAAANGGSINIFDSDSDVEFIEEVTCGTASTADPDDCPQGCDKREVFSQDGMQDCKSSVRTCEVQTVANQSSITGSERCDSTDIDTKPVVEHSSLQSVLSAKQELSDIPSTESVSNGVDVDNFKKESETSSPSKQNIFLKSVADINKSVGSCSTEPVSSQSSSSSQLAMVIDDVYTVSSSQQSDSLFSSSITIKEDSLRDSQLQSSESQKSEYSQNDPLERGKPPGVNMPYYLVSFNHILATVSSDTMNRRLFDEEDLSGLNRWSQLCLSAQMLCLRLLQRKDKWHRIAALQYVDIEDGIEALTDELEAANFATKRVDDVDSALSVLGIAECRSLCRKLNLSHRGNRLNLLSRMKQYSSRQTTLVGASSPPVVLLHHARLLAGPCVRLLAEMRRLLQRVIMLYHLPQYEDMEDLSQILWMLSLVRNGTLRFPVTPVLRQAVIFPSRSDLLRYERASQLECDLRRCMENKLWNEAFSIFQQADHLFEQHRNDASIRTHDAALPSFLRKFTAMSILCYVRHHGVELYQRRRDFGSAVKLLLSLIGQEYYLLSYRGDWYDRLTLNLHQHLKQQEQAAAALAAALKDPWVRGGPRLSLLQRASKLGVVPEDCVVLTPSSLPTTNIEAYIVSAEPRLYLLEERDHQERLISSSVEDLVLKRLCAPGAEFSHGSHCEGGMVRMLFVLIFWDIIYQLPVPDAFRCDMQAAPLDLNSDRFYSERRNAIDTRLKGLDRETIRSLVDVHWEAHFERQCIGRWDAFKGAQQAVALADCMGVRLLKAICHRLCTNFRFTRSGFPDLTLWNPKSGSCRFVEVKGPNDRLSSKQILWIDFINKNGGSAQTCHVSTVSSRRRRGLVERQIGEISAEPEKSTGKDQLDGCEGRLEAPLDSRESRRVTRQSVRSVGNDGDDDDDDDLNDFVI